MKQIFLILILLAACYYARSQNLITRCEYWVDNNYSSRVQPSVTPSANYTFSSAIDYSSLADGVHSFNIRFRQTDGKWSHTLSKLFVKAPVSGGDFSITGLEYWYDNVYASRTQQSITPSSTYSFISGIDCNSLSTGAHTFNVRFRQSNGSWSSVLSQLFFKLPAVSTTDNKITACEYWMDNAWTGRVQQSVSPADTYAFVNSIDCSSLSVGAHIFNIRFRQTDGKWSCTQSALFYKQPPSSTTDNSITAYEYWMDDGYASRISQPVTPDSTYSFISGIDCNSLSYGVHTFNIRFRQTDGKWSQTLSRLFAKPTVSPSGPNFITAYEYWFNDGFSGRVKINTPPSSILSIGDVLSADTLSRFANVFHERYRDSYGNWNYADHSFYILKLTTTVFLQGLYEAGTAQMRKAQNEYGDNFAGTVADTITVEIFDGVSPYRKLLTFNGVELHTNGTCQVAWTGTSLINTSLTTNNQYYISVRHRNSIETWSQKTALGAQAVYNFTTAASKAFGNNQKPVGTAYVIFGADVNLDGIVDSGDMLPVDNLSSNFAAGYLYEDANGDGLIDSGDMIMVENNASDFVSSILP